MEAILQSIKPQYCELIAAGKKTIEVRKTKPNIPTPFKVYIYCTVNGTTAKERDRNIFTDLRGKVIGEYMCDEIETVIPERYPFSEIGTCLTPKQIMDYGGNKPIYFWHISNLVIYDKPKELSEFHKPCINPGSRICALCEFADFENDDVFPKCINVLTRPPQSWCYVEEV